MILSSNSHINNPNAKSWKDFLESVKLINLQNTSISEDDRILKNPKFLLSIKVNNSENINTCEIVFKVLEKDKIWVKGYSFRDFEDYKKKMGFDGSWKAFFQTFEKALNRQEGGKIIAQINEVNGAEGKKEPAFKKGVSYTSAVKYDEVTVTIYHPLSPDLKVKSEIKLDKFYLPRMEEFKNYNYDFLMEIYESKNIALARQRDKLSDMANFAGISNASNTGNIQMQPKPQGVNSNNSNGVNKGIALSTFSPFPTAQNYNINSVNNPSSGGNINTLNGDNHFSRLEVKKNVKRKFGSELVNPNFKKQGTRGAVFTNEENEEKIIIE
jgi:hypothetical protein